MTGMSGNDWDRLSIEERRQFWQESERLLKELATLCGPYVSDHQAAMAQELIDHNEHRVALEFLFDYLGDREDEYPTEIVQAFEGLTKRLGVTGNRSIDWSGRCRGRNPSAARLIRNQDHKPQARGMSRHGI
jgi:hypothetical protein